MEAEYELLLQGNVKGVKRSSQGRDQEIQLILDAKENMSVDNFLKSLAYDIVLHFLHSSHCSSPSFAVTLLH